MIKKLNESITIPKGKKLNEMSAAQLKHLAKLARYELNERSMTALKENHPSSRRVGEAPDLRGLDRAMAMVSDAHRTQELLHEKDEEYIKQYPKAAYYYATRVMRSRWQEAEPTLRNDPQIWKQYKLFVKSLPEKEQRYNVKEGIVLKEASNVKGKLAGQLEPILSSLKTIKTKLVSDDIQRRVKALGGDKRDAHEQLLSSVEESISKIEAIIVDFQEEGYREGL